METNDYPVIGERVLITSGTLSQHSGTVEAVNADLDKVLVYIPAVGYAAPFRSTEIARDAREGAR